MSESKKEERMGYPRPNQKSSGLHCIPTVHTASFLAAPFYVVNHARDFF